MSRGNYTIDHAICRRDYIDATLSRELLWARAKKSKSKTESLIRVNPSVISARPVDVGDKTNQTADEKSADWRDARVISYWCWVYVLMTTKRASNTLLPECNWTGTERHTKTRNRWPTPWRHNEWITTRPLARTLDYPVKATLLCRLSFTPSRFYA